jgi:orotate phosphoribosyltransferase
MTSAKDVRRTPVMTRTFDPHAAAIEKEALLTNGHFLLSSGLHSDTYFQCAKILQWPDTALEFGRALAAKLPKDRIDAVVSPAMGGLFIGHEVARALGVRHIFVERVDNVFQMKRGFEIKPGERLAVIEDVVTTAKSTAEVIAFLKADGRGTVTAVGSIANRVEDSRAEEVKQKLGSLEPQFLLKVSAKAYEAAECPMCKEGRQPLVKPGSRKQ